MKNFNMKIKYQRHHSTLILLKSLKVHLARGTTIMSWTMHDNTSAVNEAKSQPVKALSLIVCTLSIITID